MARIRVGGVKPLRASNYVNNDDFEIPAAVADLELIPGECKGVGDVLECGATEVNTVCRDCSLRELGESHSNLLARINAGKTKVAYERDLAREQARPDPQFKRSLAWGKFANKT